MSTVDDVKQRLDIVDVLSSYVKLDKAGRNFRAICPFHEEKTPSFFVFPDRQTWRCFGCGAGGDMLSFVMKKEGVDFGEALKRLAEKAGVPLVRTRVAAADEKLRGTLYDINEAAARYFNEALLNMPAAKLARDYVETRDISPKSVVDFHLGFSPAEGLKQHLLGLGYGEKQLLSLGLIGESEGRTYDRFRRRLMFPIRDIRGRIVGFGARSLDDSMPKYLNSPQSAIFDKSGVLYGIDRASGAIRDGGLAVIVEGYTDVITAHQHSFTNVVASMGTALTEKQIRILKGLASGVAFALDPDTAGDAATLRGIEVARHTLDRETLELPNLLGTTSKLKSDIRIIPLPRGKDPDDLIKEDPQAWQGLVDQALPLMEHLIGLTASKFDLTRPEGRSLASEQLLPMIAELQDDVQREFYLGRLASVLGIDERTLVRMAARSKQTRGEKRARSRMQPTAPAHSGDRLEEYSLSLLLQHPELRERAEALLPDHFERAENREVFLAWTDALSLDTLHRILPDEELGEHYAALRDRALPPMGESDLERALSDCMGRLEERRLLTQEEFFTAEGVAMLDTGDDLDSANLEIIQQKTIEVDGQMVKRMRERTTPRFSNREDQ